MRQDVNNLRQYKEYKDCLKFDPTGIFTKKKKSQKLGHLLSFNYITTLPVKLLYLGSQDKEFSRELLKNPSTSRESSNTQFYLI